MVPGSQEVKRQAEAEGLDEIVRAAGGEWRESGCSMCIGMNGDTVPRGKLSVSTSNRNFEGRQGSGARTVLASPITAAASAIKGVITDPRELMELDGMEPIKQIRSKTVVLPNVDIDTDQIIPARFLTTTTKDGLGKNLFNDWRYTKDGKEQPGVRAEPAREPRRADSRRRPQLRLRIVARARAVGPARLRHSCRREHRDRGYLPQQLAQERPRAGRRRRTKRIAGCSRIRAPKCSSMWPPRRSSSRASACRFPIDKFSRYCLMNGIDQLGFLLERESPRSARYEQAHA